MLQLHNWCSANKLEVNPTTSAAIIVPAKLHDVKLDLNILNNNQNIALYNTSKYLGVIIDNKLNFTTHIHNVENKVSIKSVELLSNLRFLLPSSTLLQLYYALLHPHFLYGLFLCVESCTNTLDKYHHHLVLTLFLTQYLLFILICSIYCKK